MRHCRRRGASGRPGAFRDPCAGRRRVNAFRRLDSAESGRHLCRGILGSLFDCNQCFAIQFTVKPHGNAAFRTLAGIAFGPDRLPGDPAAAALDRPFGGASPGHN